jgi:hypothetical protein
MATPLNFAHLDNLITSYSLCGIQDSDGFLTEGQITSYVKFVHWQLFFQNVQALLELRYVKYIMYI